MAFKIKIFVDSDWQELDLTTGTKVSYNSVLNKIGELNTRNLSHSNTFALPDTSRNSSILGLNKFNYVELSSGLNAKYLARTYSDEELIGEYYLIINNTSAGAININLLDKAVDLLDKWGSMTYAEALNDYDIVALLENQYQYRLIQLKHYKLGLTGSIGNIANIGDSPYCWFPNTVNQIGDNFNTEQAYYDWANETSGNRLRVGYFNPAQSRPVWSVDKLLYIMSTGFGYTLNFGDSIDLDRLSKLGFTSSNANKSEGESESVVFTNTDSSIESFESDYLNLSGGTKTRSVYLVGNTDNLLSEFSLPTSIQSSLPDKEDVVVTPHGDENWKNQKCLYNLTDREDSEIIVTWNLSETLTTFSTFLIAFLVWEKDGVVTYGDLTTEKDDSSTEDIIQYTLKVDEQIEYPDGYLETDLKGVVILISSYTQYLCTDPDTIIDSAIFTNNYFQVSGELFNDSDEFNISEGSDLTTIAPPETLLELISSIAKQQGWLLNVDTENEVINITSYEDILNKLVSPISTDNVIDLSDYYLPNFKPLFNTNFGESFGKVTEIGLSDPFSGNTKKYPLPFVSSTIKYDDSVEYLNDKFSDITKMLQVTSSSENYIEVSAESVSLLEYEKSLPTKKVYFSRTSYDENRSTHGIANILNFNYSIPPEPLIAWLDLVATGTKVTAKFRLPISVFKEIYKDLSKPVYVGKLGGYFIIDEIPEYSDGNTIVELKLIKPII